MESDQHRLRQDVFGHVGLRVIGGYAVCKGDRGTPQHIGWCERDNMIGMRRLIFNYNL